jgi:tRNA threonylcarbamoyl adenosine modification protein YeaZ
VTSPGATPVLLAIETATSRAVVALGTPAGVLLAADAWDAGHRHSEELLARIAALLGTAGLERPLPGSLAAVVVGTGPGGFTGLRVGLATARGIARAAGARLVGVPTALALEQAARAAGLVPPGPVAVLLPAGPAGRYLVRDGVARLLVAGAGEDATGGINGPDAGPTLLAVDLPGRAPTDALARGSAALDGLAAALLGLGAARLRAGAGDGEAVGPEYVALPRGAVGGGEVTWSHDRP